MIIPIAIPTNIGHGGIENIGSIIILMIILAVVIIYWVILYLSLYLGDIDAPETRKELVIIHFVPFYLWAKGIKHYIIEQIKIYKDLS